MDRADAGRRQYRLFHLAPGVNIVTLVASREIVILLVENNIADVTVAPAEVTQRRRILSMFCRRLIHGRSETAGKRFGSSDTPVMKEQSPRLLFSHVLMDGDDLYACSAQGLEDTLQLVFEHWISGGCCSGQCGIRF